MSKYNDIRREYNKNSLDESEISSDPFNQFKLWFDDALGSDFPDPNAMCVSSIGSDGFPSSRMVLLKDFDENGFVFFTNYNSEKGRNLLSNPKVSILFFWDKLERQIRITGTAEKTTKAESEAYFNSRPIQSRIGANVSKQSQILKSRAQLIKEVAEFALLHTLKIPYPEFWGGFRVAPIKFEFWQGRESRMHDRIVYTKESDNNWSHNRLYP